MASDTSFEINLGVAGEASVNSAATALDGLAANLAAANSAAAQAAQAMKAGEAAYRSAEAVADGAAKALERIGIAADAQRGKLKAAMDTGDAGAAERAAAKLQQLIGRQAEAAAKAHASTNALNAEAAALDRLKAASVAAAANQAQVAKSLDQAKAAASAAAKAQAAAAGSGDVGKLSSALGALGGPLGAVGQKAFGAADAFKDMGEAAGVVGPYGALAVAIVGITTAAIAGAAAITTWAVRLSEANLMQSLLAAGMAGSAAAGAELESKIADLEKRVPQTAAELQSMAADLARTGLRGKALSDALEDATIKAARLKLGDDFADAANTTSKLVARLGMNIQKTFGTAKLILPLLDGLASLVDLFSASTVTGHAMQVVFQDIFKRVVASIVDFIPKVRSAFIQLEIAVLKALIAIKPFGPTIVGVAKTVAIFAAVLVGALVTAIGLAVAAVVAFIALPYLLGEAFSWVSAKASGFGSAVAKGFGDALDWLDGKLNQAIAALSSISLSDIGANMIRGLIAGLLGMGPALVNSVADVVGSAITAAKGVLQMRSPSRVFAEIGELSGEGMIVGVEAKTGDVQGTLEAMVSPPTGTTAAPEPRGGGSAGHVFQITINSGASDPKDIAEEVRGVLLDILEGDVMQVGGAVPSAT